MAAYRDAWRLILRYAHDRTGKQPCQLDLADLDAPFVAGFLDHLEQDRGNSIRTRNARLAAIRSFFRYAALCHPEHAGLIARVLAIPAKKTQRNELCYLSQPEADALLAAPDRGTWTGLRDHALLDVALDTGLRVSELTGLRNSDAELGSGAHLTCTGKGRKNRGTPLRKQTAAVLAAWMKERGGGPGDRCSPPAAAPGSAAAPSGAWSPGTPSPPQQPARPSPARTSPRTRSGIPAPCHCWPKAWTPR